jgi:capsular polysaccharide export protein
MTERDPSASPQEARPTVGILTFGLWRRRRDVATLLGARPVLLLPGRPVRCDLIAGWGQKSTSERARRLARRHAIPYVGLEDAFLRSVRPGRRERSVGWIVDRTGVYYDAGAPSDLEAAIGRWTAASDGDLARARAAVATLRRARLSKYNHAPALAPEALGIPPERDLVLVVDQTFGDASIAGAGAEAATFVAMLDAAVAENPGAIVAVKIHPEAISGAKRGHLVEPARARGALLIDADVDPWVLIERAARVYVVSSQFGLDALIAGRPVTCFGRAAYAGWGLTDDRFPPIARRTARPSLEALVAAIFFDYCRWLDPWTGAPIDFEGAVASLAFLRDRHREETGAVCVGMSAWKRRAIAPFLAGAGGAPRFAATVEAGIAVARAEGRRLVVWGSTAVEPRDHEAPPPVVRAEDGFLRSVGLGAAFVRPASLVFDPIGIYYDPNRPSGFEALAETTAFDAALLERAARLRRTIVEMRLSKYNETTEGRIDMPAGRRRVLVPGQVEDDASVRLGSPEVRTNAELLRRARARWPDAHLIYKPHPDVHAGYRAGAVPPEVAALADRVITDVAMPAVLAAVDHVETMTSLTGFEALLRGLTVTTHGIPFYAGWGLTEDLLACPRRTRRLALDELVAVALLLYPRYVDPETGLPCPVETVVERLARMRDDATVPAARFVTGARHLGARIMHRLVRPLFVRRPK